MRILVIGAGVIGSIYAARLAAAGHDVSIVARGPRREVLDRAGLTLHQRGRSVHTRPRVLTTTEVDRPVDLAIIAVRTTQLDVVLGLLESVDSPTIAFVQHLGPFGQEVRVVAGRRLVIAFPGVGGFIRADGGVEYVEIAAQPTTIDATAERSHVLRSAVDSTGMRTAVEPDMGAWLVTHEVFIACMGAGILACGGAASDLAGDSARLRVVVRSIHEGFTALGSMDQPITPTPLRVLFTRMPSWFAVAYWRRALRGPVGTVSIAPHIRASRDDEFAALCAGVLDRVARPDVTPTMTALLSPWASTNPGPSGGHQGSVT